MKCIVDFTMIVRYVIVEFVCVSWFRTKFFIVLGLHDLWFSKLW